MSDDIETDLLSYGTLRAIESRVVTKAPVVPPDNQPCITQPATAVPTTQAPPITPTAVNVSEPPKARKVRSRVSAYRTVAAVPEISPETLARSPKLRRYLDLERGKKNAREYRKRVREMKERLRGRKMRICRACFKPFMPPDNASVSRRQSPYHSTRCMQGWLKVKHCFDGEAAWLKRIADARAVISRPDKNPSEAVIAAEYLLNHAAPDYSPHEPRPGTLMSAMTRSLTKLREKWAPHAAQAIRDGRADSMLRSDMLALLAPLVRGDNDV